MIGSGGCLYTGACCSTHSYQPCRCNDFVCESVLSLPQVTGRAWDAIGAAFPITAHTAALCFLAAFRHLQHSGPRVRWAKAPVAPHYVQSVNA